MFRVKRLHTFVLQSFSPTFLMTFFICNFILLMQLIWRYAEEITGKGLGLSVYLEFCYYASMTLVPMTLPLAILLASLMTFGNFGEKLELLSMKAAGVSLFNIMKPLMVAVSLVAVGSFFFQDSYLPRAQKKLSTLAWSMEQKSPTLSIPEGAFYSEIENMTIYVKEKDVKEKLLKDIMIYDFSEGFENVSVTLAKSGRLSMTDDKLNLVLNLYEGEAFSNFDKQQAGASYIPYRREMFRSKELIIPFDANFNRMDESAYDSNPISKNSRELRQIIDSVGHVIDSVQTRKQVHYTENYFMGRDAEPRRHLSSDDSIRKVSTVAPFSPNIDSLFLSMSPSQARSSISRAVRRVEQVRSDFDYLEISMQRDNRQYRRSGIEYYKKFSLSLACLIFFFIGAPLGAIIRKGGLGMPAVVSVVLFIAYYLIDTMGQKLVKNGSWDIIYGMSLSSAVFLPLGFFLTYKAVRDSALFNTETYLALFKRLVRLKFLYRYLRIKFTSKRRNKTYGHQTQSC
ncbi:MAG: LptF/LptG family permease [Bacteroidales bacterium]|nr:LptF/LptG family permease [Bacteroidales bacterium]